MNILFFNDTTNWYHFGCTASSIALIEQIKALGHNVTALPITATYNIQSAPMTKKGFLSNEVLQQFSQDNQQVIQI